MNTISLNDIAKAVRESTAFRCIAELQPVGGPGARVAPCTHGDKNEFKVKGHKYVTFRRQVVEDGKNVEVDCVLLDSNQSVNNRSELVFQAMVDAGELELPHLQMVIDSNGRVFNVTSLTAPHRNYDSHFYQGLVDGEAFKNSGVGKALALSNVNDVTALFTYCPTSLIYGVWNSSASKGGAFGGTKIQRVVDSEIVAYRYSLDKKSAHRMDPLVQNINEKGVAVYKAKPELGVLLTLDKKESVDGKASKPSEEVLGNIVGFGFNGITMAYAKQTTVISLRRIRDLKFPNHKEASRVGHTYLTTLALAGVVLLQEGSGYSLRSGCELQPTGPLVWELIGRPGEEPQKFTITADDARRLLREATEAVKKSDLPFETRPVKVEPSKQHLELINASSKVSESAEATES